MLSLAVLATGLVFPDFLRRANLLDIVTAASFVGLVTIGQSFVIIIGGFDLAVGSVVGLGTVIAATCAPYGWVPALAAPVLVVTLAALLAIRALAVAMAIGSLTAIFAVGGNEEAARMMGGRGE